MMYNTTITSYELAVPERWPVNQAFQIYAQIYAHFLKKTSFPLFFYIFLNVRKTLIIKGFRKISDNTKKTVFTSKESPIDYKRSPISGAFLFLIFILNIPFRV